jgi:serine/threonine protein kinase
VWNIGQPNHYVLEKFTTSVGPGRYKFGIGGGVRFEFLGQLVAHYERQADGICCKLKKNVNKGNEIPVGELTIEDTLLGEGEFGEVRKGVWTPTRTRIETYVAIKVLKSTVPQSEQAKFRAEGLRMLPLNHKNVVKLLGFSRMDGKDILVTEYVRLGGLRPFIRKRNKAGDPLRLITLKLYIDQVAEGMAYLEEMNVLHRDLALRNILIDSKESVKISDFGMSRAAEDYYTSSRDGVWPLKWYAPESVFNSKFSSKSDVWSFGVCAWEILSHGKKPYSEFKTGQEVVAFALDGRGRLEQPDGCPRPIYMVLLKCWTHDPVHRPSFEMVQTMLAGCDAAEEDDRYEAPPSIPPPVSRASKPHGGGGGGGAKSGGGGRK